MADQSHSVGLFSLPLELKRAVLRSMDLETLKCIRQTSHLWATLGEPYLISPIFTTLPHRPDFPRLLSISQHPTYSHLIHSVVFNLGDVNEYHARHNYYFATYMRAPEERSFEAESAWTRYYALRPLKDLNTPSICDPNILFEAFSSLPNLSSLSVSLTNCPFPDEPELALLRQVWRIPSTRSLPRVLTTSRFTTILTSLLPHISKTKLKSLAHDCLPVEFFVQKQSLLSSFDPIFSQLTEIDLKLDYSDSHNNLRAAKAFENLAACLKSSRELKNLRLAWRGRRKVDISVLFRELLPDENTSSENMFPELQKLHLEGIASPVELLVSFLLGLRSTLTELELGGEGCHGPHQLPNGGVHLINGSFRDLFLKVEEGMVRADGNEKEQVAGLERFVVKGDLLEMEADGEDEGGFWSVNEWTRVEALGKRFQRGAVVSVVGLVP